MIFRYWMKRQTHWGHRDRLRLHHLMFRTTGELHASDAYRIRPSLQRRTGVLGRASH